MVRETDWKWVGDDDRWQIIIDYQNGSGIMYTIVSAPAYRDSKYYLVVNNVKIVPPSRVREPGSPPENNEYDDYCKFWSSVGTGCHFDEEFSDFEDAQYAAMVHYSRDLSCMIEAQAYDDHPPEGVEYAITMIYEKYRVWQSDYKPTAAHYGDQIRIIEEMLDIIEEFTPEELADIKSIPKLRAAYSKYRRVRQHPYIKHFLDEGLTHEDAETMRRDLDIMRGA